MKLEEPTDALLGESDTFHFFMPIEKSEKDGKRVIQGIASTDHRDLQGEVVSQKGIDYNYFLRHGYINDDHKEGPEHKVGEPLDCKLTGKGLWIKGYLYKGKPRAEHWWEHINTLEQSNSKRRVGFSIQGKILRRQGKTIAKCWLQDVAITASPVNTNTFAEVVKSLSGQAWCLNPVSKACSNCSNCPGGCDDEEKKALTAAGQGQIMMPESLEGSAKLQTFKSTHISYGQAVEMLQRERGYGVSMAKAIADAIFVTHGNH